MSGCHDKNLNGCRRSYLSCLFKLERISCSNHSSPLLFNPPMPDIHRLPSDFLNFTTLMQRLVAWVEADLGQGLAVNISEVLPMNLPAMQFDETYVFTQGYLVGSTCWSVSSGKCRTLTEEFPDIATVERVIVSSASDQQRSKPVSKPWDRCDATGKHGLEFTGDQEPSLQTPSIRTQMAPIEDFRQWGRRCGSMAM